MYGKHFAQTYTGSMFGAGPVVFALWGYVIANTRRDGTVELNTSLVAAILGAELQQVNEALTYLTSPDIKSRSKEFDGRRLLPLGEYLYQVPNYQRFNSMRNDDERREYNRLAQRESRKRRSKNVKIDVSHGQPPSASITVPVAIPVTESTSEAQPRGKRVNPSWSAKVIDTWNQYGGSAPVGPLVAATKPVYNALQDVDRLCYGLAKWLVAGNAKYGPAAFARDWRSWVPDGKPTSPSKTDIAIAEWLAKHG